jgi:hypothetical protein
MAGAPSLGPAVYIAGVAETPLGKVVDQTELSMVALAAREALAEAGMALTDVDGIFVNYMGEEGSVQVGEYLASGRATAIRPMSAAARSRRSSIMPCWRSRPAAARWLSSPTLPGSARGAGGNGTWRPTATRSTVNSRHLTVC